MPRSYNGQLDRLNRESAQRIRESAASNADSARHVEQSHEAVERSLQLLNDTAKEARGL